jgi:hypothetical protein
MNMRCVEGNKELVRDKIRGKYGQRSTEGRVESEKGKEVNK